MHYLNQKKYFEQQFSKKYKLKVFCSKGMKQILDDINEHCKI